ncbi:iron chelate uptake ABC transporter family permease subunit [Corynebacterium poyangense]|uniref:Iron chelate uptake ABC transporter family permease subunit n=1 Tax=Corynebacterium poyangense TaxID=2684405 RepID=A0A7H0SM63_9CORY|nr:iron chelate uptake ABC transporter family permease subunit [Corynebacterium poyangense]MBZ8176734.1 iron chelate uptake ABC transporter family permease subunit [Corynebacterium poyangense]QNQ89638.1 iron chelate uptake ABC transporter family permease subunit [Corynebacterium poyangense]
MPPLTWIQKTKIASRPAFRVGPISSVWRPWPLGVTFLLGTAAIILLSISLGIGDYPLSIPEVLRILVLGDGSRLERIAVLEWRLPRALTAIVVGSALGLSGALTQSVTRNPLASPDILGITMGASAAAVGVITLSGRSGVIGSLAGWLGAVGLPTAALFGGVLTGALMWALAWKNGLDPFRLVLVGIILSAVLNAAISFLLIRASLKDATTAQFWLAGSLSASNWDRTIPITLVLILCIPLILWMAFGVVASSLGRDIAYALGQNVTIQQGVFLLIAVILAAVAVAAAGPIGFVAFVAPQLALRLCRLATPPLIASALMGAVLLLAADVLTQVVLPGELPVGLLTSTLGGVFLVYLLINTSRKTSL